MKKKALVVLTDGFEEIEAITPIDLLRRAETEVTVASAAETLEVTGKTGVNLRADAMLDACLEKEYDLLVLPGGPGVFTLRQDVRVLDLIRRRVEGNLPVAAICAAPLLLLDAGVLEDKAHTAHGTVLDELGKYDEATKVYHQAIKLKPDYARAYSNLLFN